MAPKAPKIKQAPVDATVITDQPGQEMMSEIEKEKRRQGKLSTVMSSDYAARSMGDGGGGLKKFLGS